VAEIGVDMDVFPGEHNLALHSGMCPGNNVSVGKKSSRTRQGKKHLKATLGEMALGTTGTKNSIIRQNTKAWWADVARKEN